MTGSGCFGISVGEFLFIAVVFLLLYGDKNLPQTLKKFSKQWMEFRKFAADTQASLHEVKNEVSRTLMSIPDEIEASVKKELDVGNPHEKFDVEKHLREHVNGILKQATTQDSKEPRPLALDHPPIPSLQLPAETQPFLRSEVIGTGTPSETEAGAVAESTKPEHGARELQKDGSPKVG